MPIRNCKEIGENLQLIMKRLLANDNLVKLLYYTNDDPLGQDALTNDQKTREVFNKLIRIVPYVGSQEVEHSLVAIQVNSGITNNGNSEFRDILLTIEVIVPFTQMIIKNTNLRQFEILGEIQLSLNGKTVNGLGKLIGGDFELSFVTEEVGCYAATYSLTVYD